MATACNLINNEMKQFIISSETDVIREAEERVSCFLQRPCYAETNEMCFGCDFLSIICRVTKWKLHVLLRKKLERS